jgi:hypothetical protein
VAFEVASSSQFSQLRGGIVYLISSVVVGNGEGEGGDEVEEGEEEGGGSRSEQKELTTEFLSGSGFKLLLTLHSGHTTISGAESKEP